MWQRLAQLDRSRISVATGCQDALAMVVPLVVGAAIGQLLPGLIVGIGALNVSF